MGDKDDIVKSTRSGWDPNQTVPNLRPPREPEDHQLPTVLGTLPSTRSDASPSGGVLAPKTLSSPLNVDAKEFKSRLSADAKEFVPRCAQNAMSPTVSIGGSYVRKSHNPNADPASHHQQNYYPPRKGNMQSRLNKYQCSNGTESNQEEFSHTQHSYVEPGDFISSVIRRLNEYMQEIIVKPGRFDALGRMLVEESAAWFGSSQIVVAVVDAIVCQAIIERNFQYTGARLCSLLSAEWDTSDTTIFKNHLYKRMKKEYDEIFPLIESQPGRVHGFIGFLAELYSQMRSMDSNPCLGEYFLNIIDKWISTPTAENVKRVCQLLKLSGRMLDKDDKEKMEAIMEKLGKAGYETKTHEIVASVITLRHQNWGEEVTEGKDDQIDPSLTGQPCLQSEAIQYGPDGMALSKEESDFLQDYYKTSEGSTEPEEGDDFGDSYAPYDDGMDEEIEEGFLEFLKESKQI